MSKPFSVINPSQAAALSGAVGAAHPFNIEDRKIFPVETSSYQTVNFQDPSNENALLYSSRLSACAVVLIKNFNEETGKYDNVVTMAHFYPANAYHTDGASDNLKKVFANYQKHGGSISDKTSVILLGGGLLPGEDVRDTTPLGPLLDAIHAMREAGTKFKFTRHEASTNDLRGMMSASHPESQSSAVFVNKEGTAIIGKTKRKSDKLSETRMLSKQIGSMPLELLSEINSGADLFYPEEAREFMRARMKQIAQISIRKDSRGNNTFIFISDMRDVVATCQGAPSKEVSR